MEDKTTTELTVELFSAYERWQEVQGQLRGEASNINRFRSELRSRGINIALEKFDAGMTTTTSVESVSSVVPPMHEPGLIESSMPVPAQQVPDRRDAAAIRRESMAQSHDEMRSDSERFAQSVHSDFQKAVNVGFGAANDIVGGFTGEGRGIKTLGFGGKR